MCTHEYKPLIKKFHQTLFLTSKRLKYCTRKLPQFFVDSILHRLLSPSTDWDVLQLQLLKLIKYKIITVKQTNKQTQHSTKPSQFFFFL